MNPSSCQTALDAFVEFTTKEEQRLEGVSERCQDGCRELILLRFSGGVLSFLADADHDTIEVRYQEAGAANVPGLQCVDSGAPWSSLIGQSFGWGWATINQQGYQDGVLLSFGGLEPSVMLSVTGSSLHVHAITEASR